ncbi:ABC transporter substrate-binding protein [Nocardioides sp. SYSU DS0663]|uniref:ABC transporter substrate-binding protein n=1 Tax=Nocardioides sp. SYSU DS0663 TaxID=3416445 RepID=UPI003F4C7F98
MPQPHPAPARRLLRSLAAAATLALPLTLAACGEEGSAVPESTSEVAGGSSEEAGAEQFPVDVTTGAADSGQTVTIPEQPTSIVSLSPTATETLWAVGAGDQVVAVDDQSDYPEGVPTTKLSGFTPNVEAILGYEPDLVVTSSDDEELVSGLEKAAVPTLVLPSATDLEDAYGQIERVGQATGHAEEAAALVEEMRAEIEATLAEAPETEGVSYFHELDPTLYTVTGETFIGEVYGLFGMESIADAAGGGDDYPQLSAEYVVEADPDVVFLADGECCDVTPEQVAQRPGWSGITAVENDQVHVLDEDVASRWGPRIVDFVETIGEHVSDLEPAAG